MGSGLGETSFIPSFLPASLPLFLPTLLSGTEHRVVCMLSICATLELLIQLNLSFFPLNFYA